MLLSFLISLLVIVLLEALGSLVQHIFVLLQDKEYAYPLGIVTLFAALELLFLTGTVLHLGPYWSYLSFFIIFILLLLCLFFQWRKVMKILFRWQSIIIILSTILGLYLTYHYTEFNLNLNNLSALQGFPIWQNILQNSLSSFHLSFTVILIVLSFWFIGSFTFNVVDHFKIRNPWFCFCLLLAGIFWSHFRYDQLIQVGTSKHWYLLFVAFFLLQIYRYYAVTKTYNLFFPLAILAGLFVSDSFWIITCEILLSFVIFQFKNKEIKIIYHLLEYIWPLIFYLVAGIGQENKIFFILFIVLYIIILKIRKQKIIYTYLLSVEEFMLDYYVLIFFILLPFIFMLTTYFYHLHHPGLSFFSYLSQNPINYYFFMHSNILEILLSILRWIGVFIFLWQSHKRKEDQWIRILLCTIIIFINPLMMGMISNIAGLNALSNSFVIIFNPFTDLLSFIAIYELFQWTIIGQWILELILVVAVLLGHGLSYLHLPCGLYTKLLTTSSEVQR